MRNESWQLKTDMTLREFSFLPPKPASPQDFCLSEWSTCHQFSQVQTLKFFSWICFASPTMPRPSEYHWLCQKYSKYIQFSSSPPSPVTYEELLTVLPASHLATLQSISPMVTMTTRVTIWNCKQILSHHCFSKSFPTAIMNTQVQSPTRFHSCPQLWSHFIPPPPFPLYSLSSLSHDPTWILGIALTWYFFLFPVMWLLFMV